MKPPTNRPTSPIVVVSAAASLGVGDDAVALPATSSATATLGSTDPVLVYSNSAIHTAQSTIGSLSAIGQVTTATSATTGTNLTNYGISFVTGTTTAFAWLLADPVTAGQTKTVFWTSSTSTASLVSPVSATLLATDTQSGTTFTFSKSGAFIALTAKTTGVWAVTDRSASGVACT